LRNSVNETTLAEVHLEVDQYCATFGDSPTRRLMEGQPQIILIDMSDAARAIRTLKILHTEMPETWLFVTTAEAEKEHIIDSMRAGAREFLPLPIDPNLMNQSLARYITEHKPTDSGKGTIYCLTSPKDGVGTTCVAINTAVAMAGLPNTRVALIDLNSPVGDIAAYLNLKPQFTVADALASSAQLDPVQLETLMSPAYGISVLAGFKDFQPKPALEPDQLSEMLEVVSQSYTHTFIDFPASIDQDLLQVLIEMTMAFFVVFTPELPSMWRTDRLLRFLSNAGGTEKLRLIVNRVTKDDEYDEKAIMKTLDRKIYWKLPNNYRATIGAINEGKPVVKMSNSALVSSYMKLAQELSGQEPEAEPPAWWRPFGLFQR